MWTISEMNWLENGKVLEKNRSAVCGHSKMPAGVVQRENPPMGSHVSALGSQLIALIWEGFARESKSAGADFEHTGTTTCPVSASQLQA